MPIYDVSSEGVRVLLDSQWYGTPGPKTPLDVEGTVLAIRTVGDWATQQYKQGNLLELLCNPEYEGAADVFIRWDTDIKDWYASGPLILRSTKASYCVSIWNDGRDGVQRDFRPYHELCPRTHVPAPQPMTVGSWAYSKDQQVFADVRTGRTKISRGRSKAEAYVDIDAPRYRGNAKVTSASNYSEMMRDQARQQDLMQTYKATYTEPPKPVEDLWGEVPPDPAKSVEQSFSGTVREAVEQVLETHGPIEWKSSDAIHIPNQHSYGVGKKVENVQDWGRILTGTDEEEPDIPE